MYYLRVLGFQLKVELDCDSTNEFLIQTEDFMLQINSIKDIIEEKNPDVIILPEMCYVDSMKKYYTQLSKDKLVIAGSIYRNGINYTIVFSKGDMFAFKKRNASALEPMVRFVNDCDYSLFTEKYLSEHMFLIKDKSLVVLNCMEYYKQAYFILRSCPNIFGTVCVCSNNNVQVFLEETKAIHNHVEDIYTFMVNSVNTYKGISYAKGESYVYGPVQRCEQEWLAKEGLSLDHHVSSILKLGSESEYFYGEFLNGFSRFGRSDNYVSNPRNVEVGLIRKKVLK